METLDRQLDRLAVELLIEINDRLRRQERKLNRIIMSQANFDAQVIALNEAVDAIGFRMGQIEAAVTAEAAQIAEFIANHPDIDTSALDGIEGRLIAAGTELADTAVAVGGIFEPAVPATDTVDEG